MAIPSSQEKALFPDPVELCIPRFPSKIMMESQSRKFKKKAYSRVPKISFTPLIGF